MKLYQHKYYGIAETGKYKIEVGMKETKIESANIGI